MRNRCREMLYGVLVTQVSEVSCIQRVEDTFLPTTKDEMCSRDQRRTRRVEVYISLVQRKVVRRCEPVEQFKLWRQFQEALAEVPHSIPASVTGHHIHVAVVVCSRALPGSLFAGGYADDAIS